MSQDWNLVLSIGGIVLGVVGIIVTVLLYRRSNKVSLLNIRISEVAAKGHAFDVLRDKNGDPTGALSFTAKTSGGVKLSGKADVQAVSGKKGA